MPNKKLILTLIVLVIVVGAAASVAGGMLNSRINPLSLLGIGGRGVVINIIPVEELSKTQAEMIGQFEERKDNIIILRPIPLKLGAGGIVARSSVDTNNAAGVEVVITTETSIYRDTTTDFDVPLSEGQSLQQTVEESTITVWGHKSGDRIIAEVLVYRNPRVINQP